MKIAIYLRKSRKDKDSEDTLLRHRETLLRYANEYNLEIYDIYEEIISGEQLFTRTEMLRLMDDMEHKLFEAVLCMDIDRLGRGNLSSQGIILECFKNNNCKIITPRHIYDLCDELDEQYSEFEAFMARQEYRIITRRMRQGILKSVSKGGHVGEVPFGYKRVFKNTLPTLAPDEFTAPFVKTIFDLYANKGYSSQQIADFLNLTEIKPKKSDTIWCKSTILHILKNPIYTGTIYWNRNKRIKRKSDRDANRYQANPQENWFVSENSHPALVDVELFQKVQTRFKHTISKTSKSLKNPLASLIICKNCGSPIIRQADKRGYDRIICTSKGCMKSSNLIYIIDSVVKSIDMSMSNLVSNNNTQPKYNLDSQIKKLEYRKQHIYALLEDGVYSNEDFISRMELLEKQKAQLSNLNQDLSSEIQGSEFSFAESFYNLNNISTQNLLLKTMIKSIIYSRHDKTISIQLNINDL